MAAPTRGQIQATFNKPKYKVEIWNTSLGAGFWQLVNADDIVSISGSIESTGNTDNGISFGTSVEPSLQITIQNIVWSVNHRLSDSIWLLTRLRVSFGFDTSDYVVQFVGVIKDRTVQDYDVTFNVVGLTEYIRNTKIYTPVYITKPYATETTVATVENPEDSGYTAGLINLIFWESGGRPYEQKDLNYTESSAGFKFWYSCQQSVNASDYTWLGGENLLDELFKLARAAGGQIYQGADGVMRYVQPLSFGDISAYGGTYYTFTDAVFSSYSDKLASDELVSKVTISLTGRYLSADQTILEDTTAVLFQPSETKRLEYQPQLPVLEYPTITNDYLTALLIDDKAVTPVISIIETSATRIILEVTNGSATTDMILYAVKIPGKPIGPGAEYHLSYGEGLPERAIDNNVYIQSSHHGRRLVRMVYDFYSAYREVITLSNVQYDPDRYIGEIVKVQSLHNQVFNGVSYIDNTSLYRIIRISHEEIGTSMNIDLVNIDGLPSRANMFIIGNTYSSGDTKQLSY